MGNMHIVTGYKGENHVTAADVGSLNAAIFGTGSYVLNRGNNLEASVVTNNLVRVTDGDLMFQGRHVRLIEDSYVDLTIDNGSQGYNRNDLIVARYTKNAESGVEDVNLVVIKGTAVNGSAVDPEYTEGDIINDHVSQADFPLYRVPIEDLNVGTLVQLFPVVSVFLPDAMKPSDLAAWAKAPTKPTYTAAEVGAAASSHNHSATNITSGTLPLTRGGTGATSALNARKALRITYGTSAPSTTGAVTGDLYFKY